MKKILYFAFFPDDASAYYRSTGVLPYINNPNLLIVPGTPTSFAQLTGYDILVIQRPCEVHHYNLMLMAKDMGIKVIVDFDDDPLHLEQDNPMWEYYENKKKTMIDAICLADEIWVSTQGIKSAFRLYNQNIHIIKNSHNDYLFPVAKKRPFDPKNKTVVWRGGSSHEYDVYENSEQWVEIINRNTDWTFKFIGCRFKWMEQRCGKNYISLGGASTIQFYHMLHDLNAPIFFYPLRNTKFNRSKSNCSWLEATYSGSAYFGERKLPEFDIEGVYEVDILETGLQLPDKMEEYHDLAWMKIQYEYLLSNVNKLRETRLIEI